MTFNELIKGIKASTVVGEANVSITGVEIDSRKIKEDNLFVIIKDTQADGHRYTPKTMELGVAAILREEALQQPQPNVTYAVVRPTEDEVEKVATRFFGDPSKHFELVGVTGTSGETTIATLLYNLFRKLGYRRGLLSTVCNSIEGQEIPADHATPDSIEPNKLLAKMPTAGCEYVSMECSPYAIAQKRIGRPTFTGGIFTNLTHDHLDYHKTFENCRNAKKSFFDGLPKSAFVIVNTDGKNGVATVQSTRASVKTYSIRLMADFKARIIKCHFQGMYLAIDSQEVGIQFTGRSNVSNLLAVYGAAHMLGKQRGETLIAMSTLHTVSGRVDMLQSLEGFTTIVDYAHTPDALKNMLLAIHEVGGKGHIITVCSAGGNRNKNECPLMAKQTIQLSGKVIITSNSPCFEDSQDIINDMLVGLNTQNRKKVLTIADRKETIRTVCMLTQKQDVILIAGKGHETYQKIKDVKHRLDDKEVLCDIFVQ